MLILATCVCSHCETLRVNSSGRSPELNLGVMITKSQILALLLVCGIPAVQTVDGKPYMSYLPGGRIFWAVVAVTVTVALLSIQCLYRFTGPPTLNMNPKEYFLREGADAILKCIVVATPQALSVVWTKEGSTRAIAPDNDKYMGGVPQSPSLIITKIEQNEDQGNYICMATNAAGQEHKSVKLTIESKTHVRISDYCTPDKRKDIEQRAKFVHGQMVNTLSDHIYPEAEEKWVKFTQLIRAYMPPRYVGKHVQHIVGYLIQQKVIEYGKYDKLYEAVYEIDKRLSDIIEEAESEIKTIRDGGMPGEKPVENTFIFAGTSRANAQPYIRDMTEQFPKPKLRKSGNISQDMTKDLPNRKLSFKEIGRLSKYIGKSYQMFFVDLDCPVEIVEQEMEEHRHLAFRSRIAKIFIHLLKTEVDTGFLAIGDAMSRQGMDPAMLLNILSSNRNMTFTDEALPCGWLKTYLSINDVPIITEYIDIKLYINLFLELGLTPRTVDDFDEQYRNKRTLEKITALLTEFINETDPRPTINTILLAMRECDMDIESLIRALKPT